MELWLIYAIISVLFLGLYNFGLKMVAERKYDTALVWLFVRTTSRSLTKY